MNLAVLYVITTFRGVGTIGDSAFYGSTSLTTLTFGGCDILECNCISPAARYVIVTNRVVGTILDSAFYGCTSLRNLTFGGCEIFELTVTRNMQIM